MAVIQHGLLYVTDLAPNLRSAERKVRMRNQWGFACGCSLCTAPDHTIRASDERLAVMEQLEQELNDLSFNRTASMDTAELFISLHKQERLDGVIGDAYMYAAFENAYLGNKRLVQKYAALAIEHMAIWRGVQHQYYLAMVRLFYAPEGEKSWMYFDKVKAMQATLDEEKAETARKTQENTTLRDLEE
jgi:hypothetical protein